MLVGLALAAAAWLVGWSSKGPLLPFDAPATHGDLLRASLPLSVLLCLYRAAGLTTWPWYVASGLAWGLAVAARWTGGVVMLPLWLATSLANGLAAALTWLLLRRGPPARFWVERWGVRVVGAVTVLLGALGWVEPFQIRDVSFATVQPTSGGGRLSEYRWFAPGFLDSSWTNDVFYTPPGWWARKELVFELGPEDTLRNATRTEYSALGERQALAVWTRRGGYVAKRILSTALRWKGDTRPVLPTRSVWRPPILDFPCFLRGFEAPASRRSEGLATTAAGGPPRRQDDLLIDTRWGAACLRPGTWQPSRIDLAADRFYEIATDLPHTLPGTFVYSSPTYDQDWHFDLAATLAERPDLAPLPLPDATAMLTVLAVPLRYDELPDDDRYERLVALPDVRVACTAEAPLRRFAPTELRCASADGAPAARLEITGLWGDPNPQLVAVSLREREQPPRYLVLPFGWNVASTYLGLEPVRVAFLRIERRQPG